MNKTLLLIASWGWYESSAASIASTSQIDYIYLDSGGTLHTRRAFRFPSYNMIKSSSYPPVNISSPLPLISLGGNGDVVNVCDASTFTDSAIASMLAQRNLLQSQSFGLMLDPYKAATCTVNGTVPDHLSAVKLNAWYSSVGAAFGLHVLDKEDSFKDISRYMPADSNGTEVLQRIPALTIPRQYNEATVVFLDLLRTPESLTRITFTVISNTVEPVYSIYSVWGTITLFTCGISFFAGLVSIIWWYFMASTEGITPTQNPIVLLPNSMILFSSSVFFLDPFGVYTIVSPLVSRCALELQAVVSVFVTLNLVFKCATRATEVHLNELNLLALFINQTKFIEYARTILFCLLLGMDIISSIVSITSYVSSTQIGVIAMNAIIRSLLFGLGAYVYIMVSKYGSETGVKADIENKMGETQRVYALNLIDIGVVGDGVATGDQSTSSGNKSSGRSTVAPDETMREYSQSLVASIFVSSFLLFVPVVVGLVLTETLKTTSDPVFGNDGRESRPSYAGLGSWGNPLLISMTVSGMLAGLNNMYVCVKLVGGEYKVKPKDKKLKARPPKVVIPKTRHSISVLTSITEVSERYDEDVSRSPPSRQGQGQHHHNGANVEVEQFIIQEDSDSPPSV